MSIGLSLRSVFGTGKAMPILAWVSGRATVRESESDSERKRDFRDW